MGGSGGGSSGTVSYPTYMQTLHGKWLDNAGGDTPNNSLVDAINAAYGNSPYAGIVAFDPDVILSTIEAAMTNQFTVLAALNHIVDFTTALASARIVFPLGTVADIPIIDIDAERDAFDLIETEQLNNITLPKFKLGMLNINAINTSSYVIGEAILRGMKDRSVAQHTSEYRIKVKMQSQDIKAKLFLSNEEIARSAAMSMMSDRMRTIEMISQFTHLYTESLRLHIVTKKEEAEEQNALDESDANWNLGLFRHGANLLAGISGGVTQGTEKKSKAVSALGGALSGAATGAAIGTASGAPGWGTAIGAVAGATLGYFNN